MHKHRKSNLYTTPYLNSDSVKTYLDNIMLSYSEKKLPHYEKIYPRVAMTLEMHSPLLIVMRRILNIIYMSEKFLLGPTFSLAKQNKLILILQNLNQKLQFDVIQKELTTIPGWQHGPDFAAIFDFFNADTTYLKSKEIPQQVETFLKVQSENISQEIMEEYMKYLSQMTRHCIQDLIEDALDNFEYLRPGVHLLDIEDTRKKPEAQKSISGRSVMFQFSEEPEKKALDSEEIKKPLHQL